MTPFAASVSIVLRQPSFLHRETLSSSRLCWSNCAKSTSSVKNARDVGSLLRTLLSSLVASSTTRRFGFFLAFGASTGGAASAIGGPAGGFGWLQAW